ncbi:MAG: RDD family protein [Planctomycetes bacterium]|nr:RDD family protein [Planctomycetota bacterium]
MTVSQRAYPTSLRTRIAILAIAVVSHGALAQTAPVADVRAAGDEKVLWLARTSEGRTDLVSRSRGGPFGSPRSLARPVAELAALKSGAIVVLNDGSAIRYAGDSDDAMPLRNLPGQRVPVSLAAKGDVVYALLPPDAGEEDASAASPRVVRFDGQDWAPVSGCEPIKTSDYRGRRRPRLLAFGQDLLAVWRQDDGRLLGATLPINGGSWTVGEPLDAGKAAGFWVTTENAAATLVVAQSGDGDTETLAGWRIVTDDGGRISWTSVSWQTSASEPAAAPTRFDDAIGFNQQLALVTRGAAGRSSLVFARAGQPPTEPNADVAAVFDAPIRQAYKQELVRMGTFLLLVLLLIGLFVFRRDSVTRILVLPPNMAVALSIQRLVAALIDLTAFAWSAAYFTDVEIVSSLQLLFSWGVFSGPNTALPPPNVVLWWGLTAFGYSVYCFVMEAALGRTIGKLIVGTRVAGENAQRPTFGQAAIRNAMRLLELTPQFWIFAFLIVMSRNRQRLGDIFARTIVIRTVTPADSRNQSHSEDQGPAPRQ